MSGGPQPVVVLRLRCTSLRRCGAVFCPRPHPVTTQRGLMRCSAQDACLFPGQHDVKIHGVPVLGDRPAILAMAASYKVSQVIIPVVSEVESSHAHRARRGDPRHRAHLRRGGRAGAHTCTCTKRRCSAGAIPGIYGLYAPIYLKDGGSGAIRRSLSTSYPTRCKRFRKPKPGLSSPWLAATLTSPPSTSFFRHTRISWAS